MTRVAVHVNDAGITLLSSEQIIYRQPGFALLEHERLTTGNDAFARARVDPRRIQHRYWSELDAEPFSDRRFAHLSAADLVSRQLEQMWQAAGSGVSELIVAIPPYMKSRQLGLLLGIAAEIRLPVVAMVDAAVAATRREYRNAVPVHVDLSLHAAMLTRLAQPGHVQIDRSEVLPGCGVFALYDTWINTVAEAFVQQSRFDPLHTAETEQMVLDNLGRWLVTASQQSRVPMQIEYRGTTYEAAVESLTLVGAAAPVYQAIATKLRTLFRAEDLPALQVSDRVGRLPGLPALLKAQVGGEIYLLEPGATARGALARIRDPRRSGEGVSLIRQLPWDQSAMELQADSSEKRDAGVPTHLLFGNTAYQIGNSPLVIGSQDSDGGRMIALASDMPGVSRRHCSLKRLNGQCVLEDHSRYGTFLNGHRIDGSSVLQVGDALRVGSPGYEFRLITTDETHG